MTPLSSQNERIQGLPEVEKQVYILLDQLETDKDNFSTYIKQYDEFFFQQKQCLSDTMISRLFLVRNPTFHKVFRVTSISKRDWFSMPRNWSPTASPFWTYLCSLEKSWILVKIHVRISNP